jgi:alpha-tubulin suppressor-like RCC1 family protein
MKNVFAIFIEKKFKLSVFLCLSFIVTQLLAGSPNRIEAYAQIAPGRAHACALTVQGGVRCWGENSYGELGDGTTTLRAFAVDVAGLQSGVVAIAAGGNHSCAVLSTGAIMCWGNNASGQLGDGTRVTRTKPVAVAQIGVNAQSISTGDDHTCAVYVNGAARCWGSNAFSQLGDGTAVALRPLPTAVVGLNSGVAAITTGGVHTCALLNSGGIKCWGDNFSGQLGDDSLTERNAPVDVFGLTSGVINVSAGDQHTCAVTTFGSAKCWGDNYRGKLGDGTSVGRTVPVNVFGLIGGVVQISTGADFSCAILSTGLARCWGDNSDGALGTGNTISSRVPANVNFPSEFTILRAGGLMACAIFTDMQLRCWGDNFVGELGNGLTDAPQTSPLAVSGIATGATAIRAGYGQTCAIVSGATRCWGKNDYGQLGDNSRQHRMSAVSAITLESGSTSLATGLNYSCAVSNTTAKCWGSNINGNLGDGTQIDRISPVEVQGLPQTVQSIAAGAKFSCALFGGGEAKCWGDNFAGQLGNPGPANQLLPSSVINLPTGLLQIATGVTHGCAITAEHGVKCWGANETGQLGDNSTIQRLEAVDVVGLGNSVSQIALGAEHSCALSFAGAMKCWGRNANGELGNGTQINSGVPVDVLGLSSGVTSITAGSYDTCAVTSAGAIKCWGWNTFGQLGDGTTTDKFIPTEVVSLPSAMAQVSIGQRHTCAISTSGAAFCWGNVSRGESGDGRANRFVPGIVRSEGFANGFE